MNNDTGDWHGKRGSRKGRNPGMEKICTDDCRGGGLLPYRGKQTAHNCRGTSIGRFYYYEWQPYIAEKAKV